MDAFENDQMETHPDAHSDTPASDPDFIEFWVWHEGQLMPATAEELEWISEHEREREARWKLRQWQQAQRRAPRWQSPRASWSGVAGRLAAWGQRIRLPSSAHAGVARERRASDTKG